MASTNITVLGKRHAVEDARSCASRRSVSSPPANARITEIRIDAVEPFIDGHAFGTVGAYERVKGIAKGELDPNARENAGIVDLDKAPRNSPRHGRVRGRHLHPAPGRSCEGRGILYYEVLNRGNKQLGTRLLDVTSGGAVSLANALNNPTTPAHVGNGVRVRARLHRGVVGLGSGRVERECAHDRALPGGDGERRADGAAHPRGIPGRQARARGRRGGAAQLSRGLDRPRKARLFVRDRQADQRTEIPADSGSSRTRASVRLLPKGTKFTTAAIYELWYEATQPKVVGIGFAATRDVVSFLRHEKADERAPPIRSTRTASATRSPSAARRPAASCATTSNSA